MSDQFRVQEPVPGPEGQASPRPTRLALLPGLRRLWRDAHRLQLGTDPRRAVVLELADPSIARVLDLVDGARTERTIVCDAGRMGVPEAAAGQLLQLLRDAGLAVRPQTLVPAGLPEPVRRRLGNEVAALAWRSLPAPDREAGTAAIPRPRTRAPVSPAEALRRRGSARVLVRGYARLVVPVAAALAEAGVGHVDPALTGRVSIDEAAPGGLLPGDVGRPRAVAAAEAVVRVAPAATLRPLRDGTATFVVQAGVHQPAQLAALAYARRAVAHLTLEVRDGTAVIGPLVPPGGSPCLNCLDLHRRDRDPAWPALVAQLATGGTGAPPCGVTTTLVATAYAVEEVLRFIDGRPAQTVGTTIEIGGPGDERRRRWSVHPECDCGRTFGGGDQPANEVQ